jgi:hypothetical protein
MGFTSRAKVRRPRASQKHREYQGPHTEIRPSLDGVYNYYVYISMKMHEFGESARRGRPQPGW